MPSSCISKCLFYLLVSLLHSHPLLANLKKKQQQLKKKKTINLFLICVTKWSSYVERGISFHNVLAMSEKYIGVFFFLSCINVIPKTDIAHK